ncbi:hypothetical protein [Thalassospira australica]|uniref:hypothetical protein n=1 Tax=Thalassospira australica TaxID=1528106 RepID=UPI00068F795D|nr:hypothetical protein [Thalassospira australica]
MSIGENWRQISPGNVSSAASDVANNKFAQSNAADALSENAQGRTFSQYMFGEDGFEFTDFLDVVNPLQHIPGVGMVYRSLTGDELGNGARVVGGGLFGGVFGLAGAAIDAVVDAVTGDDTGSHVMAFVEDSFGGSGIDDGTAVADATKDPSAQIAENSADQGGLVLPWMTGAQTSTAQAASPQEQATIVQPAPRGAVDQTILAAADPAKGLGVAPSDLNVPWAQGKMANALATSPQSQTHNQPQNQTETQAQAQETPAAQSAPSQVSDPAELTVAMASAGTANPASTLSRTVSSSSMARDAVPRATIANQGGDTVWGRAASSGRISRQTNSIAISAEMAAHESRIAKQNTVKAENENALAPESVSANGSPLSAAEMAARFNAALGREKAQAMASDAVGSTNPVADQGQMAARASNAGADARGSNGASVTPASTTAASDDVAAHPLMQQASENLNGDAPVGAWFSQTMMDGLKKYQAMQKQPQTPENSI